MKVIFHTPIKFLLLGVIFGSLFFSFPGAVIRAQSTGSTEERSQLETQLAEIEEQIAIYEKELSATKTEKASLANKIKQLKTQQATLRLQIKQTALKLKNIETSLDQTKNSIDETTIKIENLQKEVAGLLRQLNIANQNIFIQLLIADSLGDAYIEIKNYDILTGAVDRLIEKTRDTRAQLQKQKKNFEIQQNDVQTLLSIKSVQQEELVNSLGEQNVLFEETKGKESNYQAILTDQKKRAAEIRSRIYELYSMTTQITFGQAVDMAKWASGLTGVRPAFLLAILTQESNLGKNVGTCNRVGDPPEKSWRVVMKPERDQEPFLAITKELGLDPDTTPVSCPMRDAKGKQIGWGGAMGPAQFIPSTWMGYKNKVTALTGKSAANPWDIRDAFIAAAIKLRSNGADGTEQGEWKAAMIYFSGSTNTRYRFYGDNVIATAKKYQDDINEL